MKLGAHIATAGKLNSVPERAATMGAATIQIFASNPRGWRPTFYTPEQGREFTAACAAAKVAPTLIHMIYLVSYGSGNEELRRKSIEALRHTLGSADTLGVVGVVTHLGSHGGLGLPQALQRLASGLLETLDQSEKAWIILENSAGAGGNIGNSFAELAQIIAAMKGNARVKVCLDTAHLLGSGYDITTPAGWESTRDQFDQTVGLDRLVAMHLNDSKAPLNSRVDRHQNIGQGHIGLEPFRAIVNDPHLAKVTGILEVPGMDGKSGPDKANLDILKSLVKIS